MSAVEILRQAREIIADKSRWTQQAFARLPNGTKASSYDAGAVCWCAMGAFNKVSGGKSKKIYRDTYRILHSTSVDLSGDHISCLNDGAVKIDDLDPHAAVLRVYDAAIAKAEAADA